MAYEAISIFDIFKISIGPSSSHTLGPWRAIQRWLKEIEQNGELHLIKRIQIKLYGSLALTGRGHYTDKAICLALLGHKPETIDTEKIPSYIKGLSTNKRISLYKNEFIDFDPLVDIIFETNEILPYHPNAMRCRAYYGKEHYESIFYSTGGGTIEEEGDKEDASIPDLPFPTSKPKDLLNHCEKNSASISEIVLQNESFWQPQDKVKQSILNKWKEMKECAYRGCHIQGILPGGLNLKRYASEFNKSLLHFNNYNNSDEWIDCIRNYNYSFNETLQWISCFALAVNEENANLSRMVTAPTNGSAGVIPSVLLFHICFSGKDNDELEIVKFLLVAGEIGTFFKKNATISGAMGGCQAEIGVASAMAAAALCEIRGGTPKQALNAAEIAMEHHLGMTCDPIGGLVQIPCIERNAMGAIKAINAAELALERDPNDAKVTLDEVIDTMWETASNMSCKYKETSKGGLAVTVNITEC
ncbi:MAG: L-serine ammonia-lyase [Bacteroidota bacterium]